MTSKIKEIEDGILHMIKYLRSVLPVVFYPSQKNKIEDTINLFESQLYKIKNYYYYDSIQPGNTEWSEEEFVNKLKLLYVELYDYCELIAIQISPENKVNFNELKTNKFKLMV